jgi:hypothetical protein
MAGNVHEPRKLREVPAEWLLERIQTGKPVKYENVIIRDKINILNCPNLHKKNGKFIVESTIEITNSRIESEFYFNNTIFKKSINFQETQFCDYASFSASVFEKATIFAATQFCDRSTFYESEFHEKADFFYSIFEKGVLFFKTKFHKNADFGLAKFLEDAVFEKANFHDEISLFLTKYEKLNIKWSYLTKPKYDKLIVRNWFKVSKLDTETDEIILSLINNFKNIGYFEDADECYYYYRNFRRRNMNIIYKIADYVLMLLYGYGVKPIRPLIISTIIFLSFSLIFFNVPAVVGTAKAIPFLDALNMSASVFLSGTTIIADPKYHTTGMLYWIFNLEKLLGSLFIFLFLVSIGKTIIR